MNKDSDPLQVDSFPWEESEDPGQFEEWAEIASGYSTAQEEIVLLLDEAGKEVTTALGNVAGENCKIWRRTAVRSLFGLIESVTWNMRQAALHRHEMHQVNFSVVELMALREEAYHIRTGQAEAHPKRLRSWRDKIEFSLTMYARAHDTPYDIDFGSDDRWEKLISVAKDARDRLAHPTTREDLKVTFDEMEAVRAGFRWFNRQMQRLFGRMHQRAHGKSKEDIRDPNPFARPTGKVVEDAREERRKRYEAATEQAWDD